MEPLLAGAVDAGPALADAGPSLADAVSALANPAGGVAFASIVDTSKFLTHWNLLLVVAVWVLIQTAKRILPDELFDEGKPLARILPIVPILACNLAVWIPGPWVDPSEGAAQRVILGTILGAICSNGHSVLSRLGLHSLLRLEADTRKLPTKKVLRVIAPPAPDDEATPG
jgi:hypothetical protein